MTDPAWLCLVGYLRCISYSQSPHTLDYAATVDSIFKRSFWHRSLFRSFSLFHTFSLSFSLSYTHIHRHTRTYRQKALIVANSVNIGLGTRQRSAKPNQLVVLSTKNLKLTKGEGRCCSKSCFYVVYGSHAEPVSIRKAQSTSIKHL